MRIIRDTDELNVRDVVIPSNASFLDALGMLGYDFLTYVSYKFANVREQCTGKIYTVTVDVLNGIIEIGKSLNKEVG